MSYGSGERDNFAWETVSVVVAIFGLVIAIIVGIYLIPAGEVDSASIGFGVVGVSCLVGGIVSYGPLSRRTTRIAAQHALEHRSERGSGGPLRSGSVAETTGLHLMKRMAIAACLAQFLMAGLFLWFVIDGLLSGEPEGTSLMAALIFVGVFLVLPLSLGSVRWAPLLSVEDDGLVVGWRRPGRLIPFESVVSWRVIGARAALRLTDGYWRPLSIPLSDSRIPEMLEHYLGESKRRT